MGVRLIAHGGLAIHHETRGQCHVRLTLADRSEIENGLRSNRGGQCNRQNPEEGGKHRHSGDPVPPRPQRQGREGPCREPVHQPLQVRQEIPVLAGRTGELRLEMGRICII